jgi:hypothetical protein
MAYERQLKRTVWRAACDDCNFADVREDNPPREIQCPVCKKWLQFEEISWTGKDYGKQF